MSTDLKGKNISNIKPNIQTTEDIRNVKQDIRDNIINNNLDLEKNIQNEKRKNPIPVRTLLIIVIIIIVIITTVILILIFTLKKDKKTDKEELLDYEEAEKLIDSERTKENHNLLNDCTNEMKELILFCDNSSFSQIHLTINDSFPKNLIFLENTNEDSLQLAKDDLDLYNSRYANLIEETNSFTDIVSQSMKISSTILQELKNEMEDMTKQFEKNIQILATLLKSDLDKNINLRNLLTYESREKYEKEIKNLNNFYNCFFINMKNITENIISSIKKLHYFTEGLKINITNEVINFKEILEQISIDTLYPELIKLKD